MPEPLLRVRDLDVRIRASGLRVLEEISFEVAAGEAIGLIGESGSGKTTLARTLMNLLPRETWNVRGAVELRGIDLLRASEATLQAMRGAQISYISQEPELALNPVMPVARQVAEVLRAHASMSGPQRTKTARAALADVGLKDSSLHDAYPNQLSGGQRQRVVIAQALISKPTLLIADEPTSALDSVTRAGILRLLHELKKQQGLALILITHHAALLKGLVGRVLVLSQGRIVRMGSFDEVCVPLKTMPRRRSTDERPATLLAAHHLRKSYRRGEWWKRAKSAAFALDDINLDLEAGRTLALVGRSGSGKTTLARCLCGIETPDAGEVRFEGKAVTGLSKKSRRQLRREMQLIFQHSATSFNPLLPALASVMEPLRIQGIGEAREREEQALAMLARVGIPAAWSRRRPHELSGGQRQRLAIARALILRPKLLILDEALAGLDGASQAQMTELLAALQETFSLAYLFITHDLRMAAEISDRVAVMHNGRIVESGGTAEITSSPEHEETRLLLDAGLMETNSTSPR
jgi:peptide/nickel transport system ATP-binding protein